MQKGVKSVIRLASAALAALFALALCACIPKEGDAYYAAPSPTAAPTSAPTEAAAETGAPADTGAVQTEFVIFTPFPTPTYGAADTDIPANTEAPANTDGPAMTSSPTGAAGTTPTPAASGHAPEVSATPRPTGSSSTPRPTSSAVVTPTPDPIPQSGYLSEWEKTRLVNFEYRLPDGYVPHDLINARAYLGDICETKLDTTLIQIEVAVQLRKMLIAADIEGVSGRYRLHNAYRSMRLQWEMWNQRLAEDPNYGSDPHHHPVGTMPGNASEHVAGLSIDITCVSHPYCDYGFGLTEEGIWLRDNCYKYGFILRYPANKAYITGVHYESWHFRYVGVELATELHRRGICLEEYYNAVPEPTPSPTPRPSATPTPKPSATPTPRPTGTGAPTATPTPRPSATPTPRPSATPSPAPTPTPTETPTPTPVPTPTPEPTPTPTPEPTPTPTPTPEPTPTPTPEPTEEPEPTPTPQPTIHPGN